MPTVTQSLPHTKSTQSRGRKKIRESKKHTITEIDRQFEYNAYIRAFFADNQGKSPEQTILCWKHKKGLPGHNKYERIDLVALKK
jgi:hypothetical protein